LRSVGRQDECVAAYRKAIALLPTFGGAYWSLANLKTFRFTDDEIKNIETLLAGSQLIPDSRVCLHFALGKAYADRKHYGQSYQNYAKGNALFRLRIDDDPDILTDHVRMTKNLMTAEFFHTREGYGCEAYDPIFIVGLPRSGSTLVEQILASHSAIEGTKELPDLLLIGKALEARVAPLHGCGYPDVLGKLDASTLRDLGEQFMASTRIYRKLGRPFFTDKMGANYLHIGLIQLILPNAKIIDMRRHPMACSFSNFTQHFDKGQTYSYRQTDLGRSYRDYVDLMAHWDRTLPGRVHRIIYEELVADPETQIRRLLGYLELPFEEACLNFHKNDRVVTTVSSEQVRTPIFKEGLEQWRYYEQWLGPLKAALGPVLDAYPNVPAL
jgi:tetratricopeptide (TPR) repeat protein